jgi:phage FluMu protein Com
MGITFGEAMRNIFSFIIGTKDNSTSKLLSQNVICKKCGSHMHLLNKLKTDFIILEIYSCPECSSISEFQYEAESNEIIRESYVYDNKISNRSSIITESEGYINMRISR